MGPAPQTPASQAFLVELRDVLERHDRALERAPRISIALSGGVDSMTLLRAVAELDLGIKLRALHIDHGLHPDSARWSADCGRFAATLGVEFASRRVEVAVSGGLGTEAAAREARYAALRDMMAADELLMTAHHGDDQLETVLLRLLRGTGVKGLTAIADFAPFGPGFLSRPLLGFSRHEIEAQARHWQLVWLHDPANEDLRYDRSFLRSEILPRLRSRWPAAARSAQRLAGHMRDAERILSDMAAHDLGGRIGGAPVARATLRGLNAVRQRNALRALIERRDLPLPSARQLEELRQSLDVMRPDAETCVQWPGAEARVYRDRLYLLAPLPVFDADAAPERLEPGRPWQGVAGSLSLTPTEAGGLPDSWARAGLQIRFRRGGERFRPLSSQHSKSLKQCFQEAGIVPWMRDRIPLLYREDRLVAVGDLWVHDDARKQRADVPLWCVRWREHPPLH